MNITVGRNDMKVENGFLNININLALEELMKMGNVVLKDVTPGTVINDKYIVLEHIDRDRTAVLSRELLEKGMCFGNNNNFDGSDVDKYLNDDYLAEIKKEFCEDQILEHTVDLFSLDGLDDYGTIRRKVSLLTIDQYRKYRKILGGNIPNLWWLSTPNSTPSGYGSGYVQCVCSDGGVGFSDCGSTRGLRPFFILRSSIFVSVDNGNGVSK